MSKTGPLINIMYVYIHTNGTAHTRPDIVIEMAGGPQEYFAGPYIADWFYFKTEEEANSFIKEKQKCNQ